MSLIVLQSIRPYLEQLVDDMTPWEPILKVLEGNFPANAYVPDPTFSPTDEPLDDVADDEAIGGEGQPSNATEQADSEATVEGADDGNEPDAADAAAEEASDDDDYSSDEEGEGNSEPEAELKDGEDRGVS